MAGGKLKEAGTAHWFAPNTGASDDYGFTALPGGMYEFGRTDFSYIAGLGFWWAPENSSSSGEVALSDVASNINYRSKDKENGYSIRCVKD